MLRFTYKRLYIITLIIYILCLPLNAINIGPLGSALRIIAVFPIGIAFVSCKQISLKYPEHFQLYFTIFAVMSVFWSVDMHASIDRVISYILLLGLLLSGSVFKYTETEIEKIKYALVWSSRLTAIVTLRYAETFKGRFRLMGIIKEDPNYLCAYYAFGVVYATSVILNKEKKFVYKIFATLELILYFYLVLVSGSRGGLLAIIASIMICLLMSGNKKISQNIKKIILVGIILTLMFSMIDYLPENLRTRFTVENVMSSGGSGRTILWEQAFDVFSNGNIFRKLFGFGTASVRHCFQVGDYREINVVHNIFIETLVELGIIGAIIYIIAIFAFVRVSSKFKDKFCLDVISCMIIMSLSTSLYTFKPYFNIMLFIIMVENKKRM